MSATRIRLLVTVNLLSRRAARPVSGSFTRTRTTPNSPVLAMETARMFRPFSVSTRVIFSSLPGSFTTKIDR